MRPGERSGAISHHYAPVDIPSSLSDSLLWFPSGHFPQMHREEVFILPPPEELKCSCNLWLIRQQRCLWPSQCHHVCNPTLSLSHTLCRGHRDERMMDAYFPAALEAAMTPTRRTAALLQSVWPLSGEKSPHLLLSTHQSGKAHNIYIEHTRTHSHTRQK